MAALGFRKRGWVLNMETSMYEKGPAAAEEEEAGRRQGLIV
jgi:hypothetical protein